MVIIDLDGAQVTLLGTAHVSRRSAAQVEALLGESAHGFAAVAVELCPSRCNALMQPDDLARMDLFAVIREGRVYMVAASLALAAWQQRLADQLGVEPGAEQRVAIQLARAQGLPVLLIDREVGTTLRRAARRLGWWQRLMLFSGLLAGLLSRERISEAEIERLKEGDVLETTFGEFAQDRADLYVPLIEERDRYMAARLCQEQARHHYPRILAVVGAGHLQGLTAALAGDVAASDVVIAALDQVPPSSRAARALPWLLVAVILGLFAWGFTRGAPLGWDLVLDWVLINGTLAALGAIIAGAHPLTVLAAFVSAPVTSLNPTIGVGSVTAVTELLLRRPAVGDFSGLRDAITSLRGWWQNRVARVLLVFILSSLGSALGTWVAGLRIAGRLIA